MLVLPAELSAAVCVCCTQTLAIDSQTSSEPLPSCIPRLRSSCHQPSDCNELILYPPSLHSLVHSTHCFLSFSIPHLFLTVTQAFMHISTGLHLCWCSCAVRSLFTSITMSCPLSLHFYLTFPPFQLHPLLYRPLSSLTTP